MALSQTFKGRWVNLADNTALSTFKIAKVFFFSGILLIAQTSWRPLLSFTLSDWCFFASVLFLLPVILGQGKREVPLPQFVWIGLGLIVVGGFLSTPLAQWPLSSFSSLAKIFYLVGIWFSVGTILLQRSEDIEKAMYLWCISAGVTSAAAAAQMIWGDIIPGTSPNWGRMTGFAEHVNDLGIITSVTLIPALYLATGDGNRPWIKFGFWFLACLIVGGLVWSGSISGLLAAVTGLLIWVIMNKVGWRDGVVLLIGGGSIIFLVSIVAVDTTNIGKTVVAKEEKAVPPEKKVEVAKGEGAKTEVAKAEGTKTEVEKTTGGKGEVGATDLAKTKPTTSAEEKARQELLERAKTYRVKSGEPPMLLTRLVQLKEKAFGFKTLKYKKTDFQMAWNSIAQNFMVGVGMGPLNGKTDTGRLVHNMLFVYWYEGGLLAFLGITLLVGAIAKRGILILKIPNLQPRLLGVSIVSAYTVFLVLALGQPIYYKRMAWFPALLLLSLYSIYKAKR